MDTLEITPVSGGYIQPLSLMGTVSLSIAIFNRLIYWNVVYNSYNTITEDITEIYSLSLKHYTHRSHAYV